MARHSNGKNTFAVAGWVLALLAALILTLAVGAYFLFRGNDDASTTTAAASSAIEPAEESEAAISDAAARDEQAESSAAESSAPESSESAPSSEEKQPEENKPAAFAENTLVLLDTSEGLAPYFNQVTQALGNTANALGEKSGLVGLWNYSSPLSETATVGYRQNIGYGEAGPVAFALQQFGTGGVPQTRSAVTAAVANAADQAAGTEQKAKVLLVTTGTAQDMDDPTFQQALADAKSDNVSLSVVHIGPGEKDAVLDDAADSFTEVTDPADQAALEEALNQAAGV